MPDEITGHVLSCLRSLPSDTDRDGNFWFSDRDDYGLKLPHRVKVSVTASKNLKESSFIKIIMAPLITIHMIHIPMCFNNKFLLL